MKVPFSERFTRSFRQASDRRPGRLEYAEGESFSNPLA